MAITTVDGIVAGLQVPQTFFKVGATMEAIGVMHSLFYTTGMPGAAAAPTPGLAGAALTTYAGQVPYTNPSSGNGYLAGVNVSATLVGTLYVCDRLWHNSGFTQTTTTAETVNSAAWPARDKAGSTNGDGVMVGLEVSTATTNAGAITNTTMSYTDQGGTAGNTATITSFPATAVAGTFVPFTTDTVEPVASGAVWIKGPLAVTTDDVTLAAAGTVSSGGGSVTGTLAFTTGDVTLHAESQNIPPPSAFTVALDYRRPSVLQPVVRMPRVAGGPLGPRMRAAWWRR